MTTKLDIPQREQCYRWHLEGKTYGEIAQQLGVSAGCVRYWYRRQRDGLDIHTQYGHRRPGLLGSFSPEVRETLLTLRAQHRRWGPSRMRGYLQGHLCLSARDLPSAASIGRYLHQWPQFRRPPAKPPPHVREQPHTPTQVHECWQMDFQLGIALHDRTLVNLHTVCDPVGEVCIGACVFPAGHVGHLPRRATPAQVQATLRTCFDRWHTLPQAVQTDGEALWTGRRGAEEFPSPLALWLRGLGIEHWVTRPGRPTDNAEVERCHRTLDDYAIVGHEDCDPLHLQNVLDQAVHTLAFQLPSRAATCHGRPPVQAHAELLAPAQRFQRDQELARFDLSRVDAHLATLTWLRKVGRYGQITLGGKDRRYSVGRAYAGQYISVRFDPVDRHFVFLAGHPRQEIGRRPARHLGVEDLTGIPTSPSATQIKQLALPFPSHKG